MGDPVPEPALPPTTKRGVRPLVVGCCVVGGGLLLLAFVIALFLPAVTKSLSRAQVESCANNLRQMWQLQQTYTMQFGGRERRFPEETGAAFWLKLTQTQPPILAQDEVEIFLCPVKGMSGNRCDYRGPSRPASQLQPGDPLGADLPGYHPDHGGNVLLKDGRVQELFGLEFDSATTSLKP